MVNGSERTEVVNVLATLTDRGWAEESDGMVTLSPAGVAAHAELAARVQRARADVVKGLAPDQYHETVRILSAMAGNVEAAMASAREQRR